MPPTPAGSAATNTTWRTHRLRRGHRCRTVNTATRPWAAQARSARAPASTTRVPTQPIAAHTRPNTGMRAAAPPNRFAASHASAGRSAHRASSGRGTRATPPGWHPSPATFHSELCVTRPVDDLRQGGTDGPRHGRCHGLSTTWGLAHGRPAPGRTGVPRERAGQRRTPPRRTRHVRGCRTGEPMAPGPAASAPSAYRSPPAPTGAWLARCRFIRVPARPARRCRWSPARTPRTGAGAGSADPRPCPPSPPPTPGP